jgi:hypothetical protein
MRKELFLGPRYAVIDGQAVLAGPETHNIVQILN